MKKKDIFNHIITKNPEIYWVHILELLKEEEDSLFIDLKQKDVPYYLDTNTLKKLEKFGLNYNYIDSEKNNFFTFVLSSSSFTTTDSFNYIIEKTNNLYQINCHNKHALFYMLSTSKAGINGQKFIEFIKKNPDFNLNQLDTQNKNLLNHALLQFDNNELCRFLIDSGISVNHFDNNSYNLLFYFIGKEYEDNTISVFNHILNHNNILHKNTFNQSYLNLLLEVDIYNSFNFISTEKTNPWIFHIFDYFIHDNIIFNELLNQLEDSFNTFLEKFLAEEEIKLIKNYQKQLISKITYLKLDQTLESSISTMMSKRNKI